MSDKICEFITYDEATKSNTGIRLGIKNNPSEDALSKMKTLGLYVFDPVRRYFGVPIRVSSFFRCSELNRKIGGASNSQHVTGEAIDIEMSNNSHTNSELFNYIKTNIDFDQLIWEFGDDANPAWVHVSYKNSNTNRHQVLRARKIKGKSIYALY